MNIKLEQVSERTAALIAPELRSVAGAVALKNFIVVIDPTMMPLAAGAFRKKLEGEFGLPVKFLLITHYHSDHVFGAAPFKDTCIIGSTDLTATILKRKNNEWSPEAIERWKQDNPTEDTDWLDQVEILVPTLGFRDKLEIRDDDLVVELVHGGGHTNCSTYAYVPHEKVLFAGDFMFAKSFPYAGDPTCDADRWLDVFCEFLSLDFEKLVPGHGPVVGRDEVEKHLAFFKALRDATREAVKADKGHDAIEVPEFYGVDEKDAWIKQTTLEHWYAFYKGAE
ncbi:MAG: MBL fold metallo-hydrolase [Chloroflexi bacterium]|nr:MBL fold metallo-hydrolase [Chloroflexota bacterium]